MHSPIHIRRLAALAAGTTAVGALAAFAGASPALATGTTIYGSGAAVQSSIQSTWIADSGQSNVNYDTGSAVNSASGFAEFGNFTGSLNLASDPTADALDPPQLDAFVAVDNAATGPESTSGTNLNDAYGASGSAAYEVTVPVAQEPLALLLSLPQDVTLASGQEVNLTNALAAEAFAGTVPANDGYPEDSWGALLTTSDPGPGLTAITSGTPTTGQFLESGTAGVSPAVYGTGGYSQITVEARTDGAGATLNLKQYFNSVDATDWPSSLINEDTQESGDWPSGATVDAYNSSDGAEAKATASTPGEVGYSTLASATSASDGAFTDTATSTTFNGSSAHDILWANLQDGTTENAEEEIVPVYANPESGTAGLGNVYTGSSVNTSGTFDPGDQTGAGNWLVPGDFTTGDWGTSTTDPSDYTHAWDPDVYNDVVDNTTPYYGLSVLLFDLGWSNYDTGNLAADYSDPSGAGAAAQAYLEYVTNPNVAGVTAATSGQYAAENGTSYFAELPTGGTGTKNIQSDAYAAAEAVNAGGS